MSSQKWRIYENRLIRERRNEEHCNAIKGMLKEQSRQATYTECNARVEAMRRQRAEALERQERLAGENFLKAEQDKENRKQITEFQERVATQLAKKKAHEARQEAVRRRVVDGSDELRVLKEKLHAAQVNKVWAKQLLEKQERDAREMQKEAVMAAQLQDLRMQSEESDLREMQQKALRMKALQKDNQELLARKNQSDEALRQFEHDKRLVEEVMAKVQDEDRREMALREERKKSAMEMLMQHREEQDRRRREDELRQAQEEEDIEAYARQKRAWEERLAREKSEQDASRWRVQQEMLRQQNQRYREAQEVERLREDLWREEKEEEDRRKELLKARKILEDKQEMLQAYQEHLEREEIRRKKEIAQEQEERQQLMARYEEATGLYQTLDLLPSATDSEIRSAYRRCALSTHPDKGGSAEAFRAVVNAFETLIDTSQRAAYDQLCSRPSKASAAKPGGLGSVRKDPPKRPAEATKSARPAKVKRPTPAKDAKDAPKVPTPPRRTAPPAAAEMEMEGGPVDHAQLFRRLLPMRKKQALEELRKLPEETLNAFAGFLQSEEVEEILPESLMLRMLALQDRPPTQKCAAVSANSRNTSDETKMQKTPMPPKAPKAPKVAKAPNQRCFKSTPPRVAKTLLKGVTKKGKSYRSNICLFRGFLAAGQNVSSLDVAIDMHISLVQMRQHIAAGLAEGKDLKEVVHGAIDAAQAERAAAGAVNLRLRFQTHLRSKFTPIVHDLDTAIQDWLRERDLKQLLGGVERARLKALRKQKQAEKRAARAALAVARTAQKLERQDNLRRMAAEKREAKLIAKQKREEKREARLMASQEKREARLIARQRRRETRREMLQQKRLAFARVKHSRLCAIVQLLQTGFEKIRRQKLLKAWGVPELPEGLQLSSFQSDDDSLCVTLRLSDGTEAVCPNCEKYAVGPYRQNFQQAVRELQELRALQKRRGDEALQLEMQRRDVEAMTAFFDNRLNQLSDQKRRIKMQEYRRAVDHQMEERRQLYDAERHKEREELARMKAEEAEQARIVEEERQSLLRMFAHDARHFPKGALVKAADFEAVGLPKPFQPEQRPMQNNNLGIPPYPVRQRSAPTPAFQPPARR
eukprot:s829_g16.t1